MSVATGRGIRTPREAGGPEEDPTPAGPTAQIERREEEAVEVEDAVLTPLEASTLTEVALRDRREAETGEEARIPEMEET